jgi:hypothetical protein
VFRKGETTSNKATTTSCRLGSLNSSIEPEKGDASAKATKIKAGTIAKATKGNAGTSAEVENFKASASDTLTLVQRKLVGQGSPCHCRATPTRAPRRLWLMERLCRPRRGRSQSAALTSSPL